MIRRNPEPEPDLDRIRAEINRIRTVGATQGNLARFREKMRIVRHTASTNTTSAEMRAELAMLELEAILLWSAAGRLMSHVSGFRARHGRAWAERAAARIRELGPERFPAETVDTAAEVVVAGAMPSLATRPPLDAPRLRKVVAL